MDKITVIQSKLHRATVTNANLDYIGSITIDIELIKAAKMQIWQKVDIVNLNNGNRFSTYIIPGEANSKEICLNGAAARLVMPNDKIIIISYISIEVKKAPDFSPKIVILNPENEIQDCYYEKSHNQFLAI